MALEDLLTALEADAAAETERLRDETDAEASRIVESAGLEARAFEQQASRRDEADYARALERRRAEARLAAAARLRDAYETCVATLRRALRDQLDGLRERKEYPTVLRALIEESLAALPSASVLRVDRRDAQIVRSILDELDVRLEVKPELHTTGGVEMVAGDGRTVLNTLEERLRNAEAPLRVLAGEFLAPATPPAAERDLP